MRILYDHQIFTYQQFGGISRYFAELMNCYSSMPDVDSLLGVKQSNNESLQNTGLSEKYNIEIAKITSGFLNLSCRYLKNNRYSKKLINASEFDIYHPTFFFPGLARAVGNKPLVLTILDMIPETFPEMYPQNSFYSKLVTHTWIEGKRELINKAHAVIAISEKTKTDLINIYGISPDKVKVIYLGNSLFKSDNYKLEVALPSRYILFVGTRNSYKNFARFIKASANIIKDDTELNIVCIGGGAFSSSELSLIAQCGVKDNISQHNVSDAGLFEIYSKAEAFVFPSLYEGFGIPIIEAFTANCPVVLSDSSCFPEIAGDAATYFDPESVHSIEEGIKQVIYDRAIQDSLRLKGSSRAKGFTWENTALETLEVYNSVL